MKRQYGTRGREIIVYPKTTYSLRAKCEKWGVEKSHQIPEEKLVLFTGTGRCGTTWISKVMAAVGYDVPHERCGIHGTASLFFLVDSDWHPMLPWYEGRNHVGERRSDYVFRHTIQIVRHPFNTIRSMSKIFNGLNYEYFEDAGVLHRGLGKRATLLRCMHLYYELNLLAEKQAELRLKLEDLRIGVGWPKIVELLGMPRGTPFPNVKPANRATGFRKAEPITWVEMRELDPQLARNIAHMAYTYGYGRIDR